MALDEAKTFDAPNSKLKRSQDSRHMLPSSTARAVAKHVRTLMDARELTIEAAANAIDVESTTIYRLLSKHLLSDATLKKIKAWAAKKP